MRYTCLNTTPKKDATLECSQVGVGVRGGAGLGGGRVGLGGGEGLHTGGVQGLLGLQVERQLHVAVGRVDGPGWRHCGCNHGGVRHGWPHGCHGCVGGHQGSRDVRLAGLGGSAGEGQSAGRRRAAAVGAGTTVLLSRATQLLLLLLLV